MTTHDGTADPRYPIGNFSAPASTGAAQRAEWIARLAALPAALREALHGLDDAQLDTPYREGGWTVRQVAHHLPDSHANAYVRFKLALTEDAPTIRPYDEGAWAELPDAAAPPELSLALLDALHARWVVLLRALPDAAWERAFRHPASGAWPLGQALAQYAWHGDHHVAQVRALRRARGW